MRIVLIYPPANDPRAPQLALPSLAAHLRANNINVDLLDVNITGLRWLLRRDQIESASKQLTMASGGNRIHRDRTINDWVALGYHIAESIDAAFGALRNKVAFFDPCALQDARSIIESGLSITCAAVVPTIIRFALQPICYEVVGVDQQRLASLINATGDDAANLFANHWRRDVFPDIERVSPDAVGITITNRQQILPALHLARQLKAKGYFVVLGGALITKFADSLMRLPLFFEHFADAVIVYEGETALVALIEELSRRSDFARVPNLLYVDRGKVRFTRVHVEDVRKLHTPDFSGLPLGQYLTPMPVLPILTGKGCYYNRCKFCDIPYINHVSRKAYRVREPEQIVTDVRRLEEMFGARHFVITDEALSPKLLTRLADALEGCTDRRFRFTGYARLEDGFTPEVCRRLASAGIRKLFFGLESGSQRTIDHMDKGTRLEVAPRVLNACRGSGIGFHIFSIVGFPEENIDSMRETLQFFVDNQEIINHPGNTFDIHAFGLELRTAYFEKREEIGIVISEAALNAEFAIGVEGIHWTNARGVSSAEVATIIATEFTPKLRKTFRRYHAQSRHLWPGFEEYAALYFDKYDNSPFPYATSLEAIHPGGVFSLRWSAAFALVIEEDKSRFVGDLATVSVPTAVVPRIVAERHETVGDWKARLLGELANDRDAVNVVYEFAEQLIQQGVLQLRL